MAYVKLSPLALFMLALFLAFPMKKIEADCSGICSPFELPHPCGSPDCRCIPWRKKVGACAHYPNPDIPYGWCFDSETEAERTFEIASNSAIKDFFKTHSNSKAKEFLKMPVEAIST
ncbi:hypothetical protein TSUD_164010 [Trifolium subterraneum]|uniref:Albumin I chain a domain-containing protein n=1 Tax=Trifolium subterraneum TaxID=3900 RepID=A0A2Z6MQL9_TRISU|nr:hypothetical protein TSUD_164010 [Trifolium subterraneum]